MNLQVNLLSRTERRYQGIVSMKLMVLGSASVLIGVTVLVLSLAGISRMTHNVSMDRTQEKWDLVNPLAEKVRRYGFAAAENQKTIEKLEHWSKGGSVPMYTVLRAVQEQIPSQMQLHNFYAAIRDAEAGEKPHYILRLSGRAVGELVAVEAKRNLNADSDVRAFCGGVRLISSQREAGDNWIFALEGRRETGGSK